MKDVTINLQGPLLFNPEKRLGLQFIIPDGKYSTRHLLFGDKLKEMIKRSHPARLLKNSNKFRNSVSAYTSRCAE
ncbi:MAG: hypothetical protein CM1200mP28_05710 [Deltaproteobacteria bacterium]|nr:MAG: hypothetical protein CM1200mP28_05710 [Deltaproteobacteria bacterium]